MNVNWMKLTTQCEKDAPTKSLSRLADQAHEATQGVDPKALPEILHTWLETKAVSLMKMREDSHPEDCKDSLLEITQSSQIIK